MTTISNLLVEVGADISDFNSGMNRVENRIDGFGSNAADGFNNAGRGLIGLGARVTALTAPITGFEVMAVNSAMHFDEAMTNTGSVLGITGDKLNTLSDQVLAIGSASRAGPQAAAEAFYDIVGGVQDASSHMAILNAAIATSEAGNADLGSTTKGLIAVMNAYNLKAGDASHVSDVFTRTVGMGVGSMDDFVSALSPVAGLASTVGISFDDLGAQAAYMSTKGFTASQSATRLQAAITAIVKPNADMTAALKKMGVESGSAALKQYGLAGTLSRLQTVLGGSTDSMAAALGTTEALGAAAVLNQPGLETFWQTYKDGLDGATDAARNIQLTSAQAKFDILQASIQGFAIMIGQDLLPALGSLADAVVPIISSIEQWTNAHPQLMDQLVPLIAIVTLMGPAILAIGTAMTLASPAVGVIAGAFTLLTSPLVLAALAIAAVGLALTNSDIQKKLDDLTGLDISGFANSIKTGLTDALTGLGTTLNGLDFTGMGQSIASGIEKELVIAQTRISGIGQSIAGSVQSALGTAQSYIADAINLFITGDFVGGTFGGAEEDSQLVTSLFGVRDGVIGAITGVQNAVDLIKTIQLPNIDLSGFASGIESDFQNLDFSGIEPIMNTHFNDILTAIVSVVGIVFGGPISIGLGIARLVGLAIENDFLGLGTFLKTSGISDSVNTAFTDLKTSIDGIIQSVFSGGGGASAVGDGKHSFMANIVPQKEEASGPLALFVSDLQRGFDAVKNLFTNIWNDLSPHVEDFKTGLQGFFDAFKDTDTEGLLRVVTGIGAVIGAIVGGAIQIGADVLGDILTTLGTALPFIGGAISSLISAISGVGKGDFGQVAADIGDFVTRIVNALYTFVGIEITVPDFSTAIEGWRTGLEGIKLVITTIADAIGVQLQNFIGGIKNFIIDLIGTFLHIQIAAAQGLMGLGQAIPALGIDVVGQQSAIDTAQAQLDSLNSQRYVPVTTGGGAGGGGQNFAGVNNSGDSVLNPSKGGDSGKGGGNNIQVVINGVQDIDELDFEYQRRTGMSLLDLGKAAS